LAPGEILQGRYHIIRLLGRGGMGAVYQAQDTRLGNRVVAVKENFDSSTEAQAQFQLEAMTLANVSHPNLPRVNDHFVEPSGQQYLVMDYVEGQDLQEMLDQRGQMTEAQALPWIEQVCDALEYLHGQNPPIIHRDIKPANIKITPAGKGMLVDFGIAKRYRPGQQTMAAARAVTSGFSPPEQYGGARTDVSSDVYALGATLYCLLTGQAPPDAMERLTGNEMISPRQLNRGVSSATEAAILRAMQLNPSGRPQSVREFRGMLESKPAVLGAVLPAPVAAASAGAQVIPRRSPTPATPPVSGPLAQHYYASFGQRLAAMVIDGLILLVIQFLLSVVVTLLFGLLVDSFASAAAIAYLVGIGLYVWYHTHFYVRSGQTPGKKLVGIKVIATDGSLLTGRKAFVRVLVYWLDVVLFYLLLGFAGFMWMFLDRNRQTWHDKAAGSYVIRV
jgi:serine/threonine-protein kinase